MMLLPALLCSDALRLQAALEARRYNIRVNSVSPGFLPTKIGESVTTKGFRRYDGEQNME